jgi:hypothetical protein
MDDIHAVMERGRLGTGGRPLRDPLLPEPIFFSRACESGIHVAFPGVNQLGRCTRKLDGG